MQLFHIDLLCGSTPIQSIEVWGENSDEVGRVLVENNRELFADSQMTIVIDDIRFEMKEKYSLSKR